MKDYAKALLIAGIAITIIFTLAFWSQTEINKYNGDCLIIKSKNYCSTVNQTYEKVVVDKLAGTFFLCVNITILDERLYGDHNHKEEYLGYHFTSNELKECAK
jgi:hypothetical protein